MEQDIKALVKRAYMGDQQAIAVLYETTSRKAYYIAREYLKDADQAQDILQDAYVKAFANLDSLKEPEKFQGWLDRIVINKCKDYLDKKQPLVFSQLSSDDESDKTMDFEDESGQFSPEDLVDYAETKRLVQEMIDELPEEQRRAIILRYLEDMPVKEIAQMMQCSEGTVKSRLNYGRKAIKDKVLALEKKGTKLYCMPLTPFLFWMFRQQVEAILVPASIGEMVFAGGSAAAAVGAGTSAGAEIGTVAGAGTSAGAEISAAVGAGTSTGAEIGIAAGSSATIGAGAASTGAGAAASATAAKAGAAVLGKAVSAKAAAVVAAVCIGGGAAGGVYVVSQNQKADQAAVQVESQVQETETEQVSETPEIDIMSYWTKKEKESWEDIFASFVYSYDYELDGPIAMSELEPDGYSFVLKIALNRGLETDLQTNPGSWEPLYPKKELEQLAEEYFGMTNLEEEAVKADWTVSEEGYSYLAGANGHGWADYYSEITDMESIEDTLLIKGMCGYMTAVKEEAEDGWFYDEAEQRWYEQRPFTAMLRCQPEGEFTKYQLISGESEAVQELMTDAAETVSDTADWNETEKENWETVVAMLGYICGSIRDEEVYTVNTSDFSPQELSGIMQLSISMGLLPEEVSRWDYYYFYLQKDAADQVAEEYYGIQSLEELAPELGWTVVENEYQCNGGEIGVGDPYCEITAVEVIENQIFVTGMHGVEDPYEENAQDDWVWNEETQTWQERKPFVMKLSNNPKGSFTKYTLEEFADGKSLDDISGIGSTSYKITDKKEGLMSLYQAAADKDYENLARNLYYNFDLYFGIVKEDLNNQYYLFDGENMSDSLDGTGIVLRTYSSFIRSGNYKGMPRYRLIVYYGTFHDGIPDGELQVFSMSCDATPVFGIENGMEVSVLQYDQGKESGDVKMEFWTAPDENGMCTQAVTCQGTYSEEQEWYGKIKIDCEPMYLKDYYMEVRRADGPEIPDREVLWDYDGIDPEMDWSDIEKTLKYEQKDEEHLIEETEWPEHFSFELNIMSEEAEGFFALSNREKWKTVVLPDMDYMYRHYIVEETGQYLSESQLVIYVCENKGFWWPEPGKHSEEADLMFSDTYEKSRFGL